MATEINEPNGVRRLVVADVLRAAVSQPSRRAVAPAPDASTIKDNAGVIASGGDAVYRPTGSDNTCHCRRFVVADVVHRALPDLTGGAQPPTAQLASVEHRTGVALTRGDRRDAATESDVYRRTVDGHLIVPDVLDARGAQASEVAATPAAKLAGVGDGAGVGLPGVEHAGLEAPDLGSGLLRVRADRARDPRERDDERHEQPGHPLPPGHGDDMGLAAAGRVPRPWDTQTW
nr:hypothetical protein [Miltoncostaea marina]